MGAAFFYHLTRSDAAQTLRMLLPKAAQAGWRVDIRAPSQDAAAAMDAALWLGDEQEFLPHGMAGGDHDDLQPVLLTWPDGPQSADAHFDCIMSFGGSDITAAEVERAQRVCIMFDGHDPDSLHHARGQWKALTGADIEAQYWAQEPNWVLKSKTESN